MKIHAPFQEVYPASDIIKPDPAAVSVACGPDPAAVVFHRYIKNSFILAALDKRF